MTNLKKIVCCLCSMGIVLSNTTGAFAADTNYNYSTYPQNVLNVTQDPETIRYSQGNRNLQKAIFSKDNPNHASKFEGYDIKYGIDVSKFQGNIDWAKVKASGVDFAIIRVGCRGYGDGSIFIDSKFYQNITGAKAAGIDVGVYFFTQAINVNEAIQEANFVLDKIQGYNLELPVYIDQEAVNSQARLDRAKLSRQAKTDIVNAFCDTINKKNYEAGVYASKSWLEDEMYANQIRHRVWVAQWSKNNTYGGYYDVWQWGDNGRVNGISGNVDVNVYYSDANYNPVPDDMGNISYSYDEKNHHSVTLEWDRPKKAAGYEVYKIDNTTKEEIKVGQTNKTSYTLNLDEYQPSSYYVKAVNEYGGQTYYSKNSPVLEINDYYISDLKAEFGSQINLEWSAVKNAGGYKISLIDENREEKFLWSDKNSLVIDTADLNPELEYTVKVAPYFSDRSDRGVYSSKVTGKIAQAGVENLAVSITEDGNPIISWEADSEKTIKKFEIYTIQKDESGNEKQELYASTRDNFVILDSLSNQTSYNFAVRSIVLENGEEKPTDFAYIGLNTTPDKLESISTDANILKIDDEYCDEYKVYYSTTTDSEDIESFVTANKNIQIKKDYNFIQIAGIKRNGETAFEGEQSDKYYNTQEISGLKVLDVSKNSVSIKFDKNIYFDSINAYVGNKRISVKPYDGKFTVDNLSPNGEYTIKLLGVRNGKEDSSSAVEIKAITAPEAINSFVATSKSSNSCVIEWTTNQKFDEFYLYHVNDDGHKELYSRIKDSSRMYTFSYLEAGKIYTYAIAGVKKLDENYLPLKELVGETSEVTFATKPLDIEKINVEQTNDPNALRLQQASIEKTEEPVMSADISWNSCGENVVYEIYLEDENGDKQLVEKTEDVKYTLKNLDGQYKVSVVPVVEKDGEVLSRGNESESISLSLWQAIVGDANFDKQITPEDALCILQFIVGLSDETLNNFVCDLNGDGKIDTQDALEILKIVVGIN